MTDSEEKLREEIMRDYTKDVRANTQILKWIIMGLCTIIALLIIGFAILEYNHQNKMAEVAKYTSDKMVELLSDYEWETEYEIETTNNEFFSGNITLEK